MLYLYIVHTLFWVATTLRHYSGGICEIMDSLTKLKWCHAIAGMTWSFCSWKFVSHMF